MRSTRTGLVLLAALAALLIGLVSWSAKQNIREDARRHVADAAVGLLEAVASDRRGIEHLAGPERVSRAELAHRFLSVHPLDLEFREVENEDPTRPPDVSLVGDRPVRRSLDEMLRDS